MATQIRRQVPPNDIFIISLGCPRNLVDSEVLAGRLKAKGFRVYYEFSRLWGGPVKPHQEKLHQDKKHSVAIVNTCAFIEDAKRQSIDIILELADLKKSGKLAAIIVAGCLSQRFSQELANEIEELDGIFGVSTFQNIPEHIDRVLNGKKTISVDKTPKFLYDHRSPRSIMTPQHSVYVKIQEGCKNFCSYCVIPKIRGPYRSRSMRSILKEISSLKKDGAKEINLIGQDTTLYGIDKCSPRSIPGLKAGAFLSAPQTFPSSPGLSPGAFGIERGKGLMLLAVLLKKISKIMKSGWVRLLYTHPAHYSQQLIDVIKNEEPICKYVDLPIQHISNKLLKKMNRHLRRKDIINLIEKLKKNIPSLAIRTSIMVGFPGETDGDFKELEEFIKEVRFDRLGVFTYSREEGTKAFDFPNQVPEKEKERRFNRIMELQRGISLEKNKPFLGKFVRVLIDERDYTSPGQYLGRTQHDAPEVDGTVYVKSKKPLKAGDFVDVKIEDTMEYDLVGRYEPRK